MEKLSKLKSKKFIIWTLIILLVGYIAYKHRLEIGVYLSCHKDYSPNWSLKYVGEDKKNMQLTVIFNRRFYGNSSEYWNRIKNIYDKIREHFLLRPNSPYHNYSLTIDFVNVAYHFKINNINANSDKIEIITNMESDIISVEELSNNFPNTNRLILATAHYDNISEFGKFNNLEYVNLWQTVSEEDCDYIRSRFPGCIVEK